MKFKELKKKKRSGFTLIEMVIVVTILGIIAGIGFMKFGDVQERSRLNADYAAASNLATATYLYIDEYPEEVKYDTGKNETNIDLEILKESGYISSIPKSQSQRNDFEIIMVKDSDEVDSSKISEKLYIVSNNNVFYPKDGEMPEKTTPNLDDTKNKAN